MKHTNLHAEKSLLHEIKKASDSIRRKHKLIKYGRVENERITSYTPIWTTDVLTISKVLNTIPITYKLADYQDNNVGGCFYQEELSPVRYPDIYLVEKFLKKRKNKVLVRWLGFDFEHDTWENESELRRIIFTMLRPIF
ncbi:uncharacterized protein LOC122850866 [Aphidius gifuensis]|uniref:uncharacterized protein LOC122850866 n=1 Tax=Aphidius gifuensis TaxID=684658 RepID=UPI001CDC602B|nr:uncharacterized protein LOC122850866 [Aphidius gifuensis]